MDKIRKETGKENQKEEITGTEINGNRKSAFRKIAFLYPGQGSQKCGMGLDFYENSPEAKTVYDQAEKALGLPIRDICFQENEKIHLTEYTQPALVTTCLAMTRALEHLGILPSLTAGLSLGEYAAVAAAGGLSDTDAIRLVRKRGLLMQNTIPAGEGAMSAVLGMKAEEIEKILEQIPDVTIANYNCPGQIVITGRTDAVKNAGERLKEAGARRVLPLKVSGPFHSPLLAPAGKELAEEMKAVNFRELTVPYVANAVAEIQTDSNKIPKLFVTGVSSPVKWQQSMEVMVQEGVDLFLEIGPGKTLAGFMKKIAPAAKVFSLNTWTDLKRLQEELKERKTIRC